MGNSGFNPRYPNYPKNPNNSPTQIFSLISAQSNKPSKFLNPSCRPQGPQRTPHLIPQPPGANTPHAPRQHAAQALTDAAHRPTISPSLSPILSISPPDQEARTKSSGLGDCRSPCCGASSPPPVSASARRWPSHRRPRPRPRRSPRRRIAGRAAADPSPAGLCVPSQAAAAGRPG